MSLRLTRVSARNYRSLADVDVVIDPVNVLFGPNGAGKSTFLDVIWFVRDCATRGVELASSTRSHGIGLLWDGAEEDTISIMLGTDQVEYELQSTLTSGRIEPFLGERLYSRHQRRVLIDRRMGADRAAFYNTGVEQMATIELREPEKLSLGRYLDFEERAPDAADLDRLLHFVHYHSARSLNLRALKQRGSEASYETWLWERGDNLWSVLRNLHDRRSVDRRYDTIVGFMEEAFPSFDGLLLEQTGPSSVYASFQEKLLREPIAASGVSDGHLQLLLLLTALFAEGPTRPSLMLFDEPEVSLHPWALAVFAKAVKRAADGWDKQVLMATHSPVLISQFDPSEILATAKSNGRTTVQRVCDIEGIQDLLDEYATGSLYMSQAIVPQQSMEPVQGEV